MISPLTAFWTVKGADDLFKRITYNEFTNSIMECTNSDLLAVWFSTLGETKLTIANAATSRPAH